MTRRTHPVIAARFGSNSAKPRVVRVYDVNAGWTDLAAPQALTPELVTELRGQGYTMVEARWRMQVKQFSVSAFD